MHTTWLPLQINCTYVSIIFEKGQVMLSGNAVGFMTYVIASFIEHNYFTHVFLI